MTAAGTVPPAKVLVMGVGVAGLQSIATARRLGAVVKAYDVRAAAKEEAESLGATFLDTGVSAEGAGRLRPRAHPRGARPPARRAGRGGRPLRRRHHHRGRAGAQGPRAAHDGDGRGHGRGRRRGGHGGGPGGQLRAHQGGRGGGAQRCARGRHGQPALGHADARQLPLRPQRGQRARAHGPRGHARPRLGRRDRGGHVRAARRRRRGAGGGGVAGRDGRDGWRTGGTSGTQGAQS